MNEYSASPTILSCYSQQSRNFKEQEQRVNVSVSGKCIQVERLPSDCCFSQLAI